MSTNARLLAEAVKRRREELDMTQLDLAANGGPSNSTLTTIENGLTKSLPRATRRKLDTGLQWVPGSARAIWERGEEPQPMVDVDIELQIHRNTLTQENKDYLIALVRAARERGDAPLDRRDA